MVGRSTAFVFISLFTTSLPCRADEKSVDSRKAAENLYEQGKQFFADGDFTSAADLFRKAYDLKPTWRILYNLGQAELAAKRNGLALEALEAYLTEGGDDIPEDRFEEVIRDLKMLREIVGQLEIIAPNGATVEIDGLKRGTAPLPGRIKVSAGIPHRIIVRKDNAVLLDRLAQVSGKEFMVLDATHATESTPKPLKDDSAATHDTGSPRNKNGLMPLGIAMTAVGADLLGAGAAFGGLALSKNADLEKKCTSERLCLTPYHDEIDTRDRFAGFSTAFLAAGGTAFAAGIAITVVSHLRKKKTSKVALRDFLVLPAIGGIAMTRSF